MKKTKPYEELHLSMWTIFSVLKYCLACLPKTKQTKK